jgi:trimeric autotransporter adhesin
MTIRRAFHHYRRPAVRGIAAAALLMVTLTRCGDNTAVTVDVATVEVTPATATVQAGGTLTLASRALAADGTPLVAPVLRWSTSDNSVATVSAAGVVTAAAPGTARIAVSSMGRSAVSTITVTPRPVASLVITPPQASVLVARTTQLSAQPLDATGTLLTGRTITWSSSDVTVARVDAAGLVTGVAPGAATIVATSEGRSAQSAVTVALPPVQSITVSPTRDTLAVTGGRQFTAVVRSADGTVLTGRTIAWSSSNVAVAIVSATGAVTALTPGTVTITASSEGRSATATLVVLARLASAVTVTPGVASLIAGTTLALATQITDDAGNVLTGRPVSFSSEAPAVASVSAAGVVTAVTPGTTRIVVASEGKTGFSTIQVVPVPVATLELTPTSGALLIGETLPLVATTRSLAGSILTGRAIEWRTGAPNVATVSTSGAVTAIAPGTAIILATVEGVSATASITVRQPPVTSIVITPPSGDMTAGQQLQLTATPRGAGGTPLANRAVTWSSSNEQVAFVSSTGLAVGVRAGTAVITATSEGISASIIITVR